MHACYACVPAASGFSHLLQRRPFTTLADLQAPVQEFYLQRGNSTNNDIYMLQNDAIQGLGLRTGQTISLRGVPEANGAGPPRLVGGMCCSAVRWGSMGQEIG